MQLQVLVFSWSMLEAPSSKTQQSVITGSAVRRTKRMDLIEHPSHFISLASCLNTCFIRHCVSLSAKLNVDSLRSHVLGNHAQKEKGREDHIDSQLPLKQTILSMGL